MNPSFSPCWAYFQLLIMLNDSLHTNLLMCFFEAWLKAQRDTELQKRCCKALNVLHSFVTIPGFTIHDIDYFLVVHPILLVYPSI